MTDSPRLSPVLAGRRRSELPSCRAAELPSCRADFGLISDCQAFSRNSWSIFALLCGVLFSGVSAFAQLTIPPGFLNQPTPPTGAGVYEWSGAAGNGDWEDPGNWVGGTAPDLWEEHLLFGNAAQGNGPITVDFGDEYPGLSSLWFEGGHDYTLRTEWGMGLGSGLFSGDHLIGVFTGKPVQGNWPFTPDDFSAVHHSQVNIESDIWISGDHLSNTEFIIENGTRGGLRLGGLFGLGKYHLIIRGHGATNFAGKIIGTGDIIVRNSGSPAAGAGGAGYFAGGQLVLSADNTMEADEGWEGNLIVDKGMAVIRADGALGSGDNTQVYAGGVLAFRSSHRGSQLGIELDYTESANLSLTGHGVWRSFGSGWTGALHNDGGENRFGGDIQFWGETGFGSIGGNLTLTGTLTGTGSFVKWGGGVITLENAANTWAGQTLLRDGVLRITGSANALSGGFDGAGGGPNLAFAGGVLELAVDTDFTRGLGTGDGQVQWLGDGGFAAYGANRTVTIGDDGTGTGSSLVWGSGSFVPTGSALVLGTTTSDAWLKFTNAIDLGSEQREVRVARGLDDFAYAELSGIISGAGGGLIKSGKGNLWLTNAGNDYTGPTIIRDGVLRGELPTDSNLHFDGIPWQRMNLVADSRWQGRWNAELGPLMTQAEYPVYALDADFTRSIGKGPGQVRWTGSGGFAAYGEDRTVMLNGSTDTVTWGGLNDFVPAAHSLVFGARDSDATVIWNTKLAGTETYFAVIQGADPQRASVRFNQQISTQRFKLYGGGRADFSIDTALISDWNPGNPVPEAFILGSELRLSGQGSLGIVWDINILNGTLTLDNTGTYRSGRVLWGRPQSQRAYGVIRGDDATLRLLGRTDSGSTIDKIGYIDIITGTIDVVNNRSDNYTELTIGEFYNPQWGVSDPAFIHFINSDDTNGTYSDSGNTPRVRLENPKDLIYGIYPWAVVNELDFAALRNNYIVPYEDYDTSDPSAWTNVNANASPVADGSLSSNKSLNSLRLINGRSIDLAANVSLTVRTLLSTGTGENFINGGSLTIRNTLYPFTTLYTYAPLTITGKFNYDMLYKAGTGTLTLSGGTSNGGNSLLIITGGTLVLNNSAGSHAVAGRVGIGQNSVLRVDRDNQFAPNAYVMLRSSHSYDRATLQFNGKNGRGLTQRIDTLAIQNGIIDFQGGTVANPNFLIVNNLRAFFDKGQVAWAVDEAGTIELWIKNWFEFEDYFLIRRGNATWLASMQNDILPYITFEGYAQGARLRYYDADYYEIVPNPEPATYGVILGAVGLGLVLLRKRKARQSRNGGVNAGRRF